MSIAVHLSLLSSKQYSGLIFFNFQVELEQHAWSRCTTIAYILSWLQSPGKHAAEADKSSTLNQIQFKLFKNYQKGFAERHGLNLVEIDNEEGSGAIGSCH